MQSLNEFVASAKPALVKKRDSKHMTEVQAIVRIRYAERNYLAWAGSITVYHDHSIKKLTETIYGIVQQYVKTVITELPSLRQTKIKDLDVILNDSQLQEEIYRKRSYWPQVSSWKGV